jgi:hypothetical protein
MTDRLHAFEAIDNFRDYGDYATAAGRRVRPADCCVRPITPGPATRIWSG